MAAPRSVLSGLEGWANLFGNVLIGLGVLAVIVPGVAGAPVVILVGLLLAAGGGLRTYFGWRAWSGGKGPLGMAVGVLALGCGLAVVFNPVSTLGTVSSLVAAYLVLDGIGEFFFAGRLRDAARSVARCRCPPSRVSSGACASPGPGWLGWSW
jgi:uncharacterized membrane protein HdeD (DUF308 family)